MTANAIAIAIANAIEQGISKIKVRFVTVDPACLVYHLGDEQ
jgi:hypothetical protein